MKKDERDKRNWERAKYLIDKAAAVAEVALQNPIFGGMAAYATVHLAGNLKKPDGNYYMHETVVRALKGVSAAYPVFVATKGGTAGVVAASAVAAAVGIAADRPDVKLPVYDEPLSRALPLDIFPNSAYGLTTSHFDNRG